MRKGNINNKIKTVNDEEKQKILEDSTIVNEKSEEKTELTEQNVNDVNTNINNQQENRNDKKKNKDKQKAVILVIIIILAVGITIGLLIYRYVKSSQGVVNSGDITNNATQVEAKKETEDKKYLVSFTDMYTINPLTITDKSYEQKATKNQGSMHIGYVEISGLQDKALQNKINKEIKDNAFYNSDKTTAKQIYHSYTYVEGNFSNILSICTQIWVREGEEDIYDEELYLNFNLVTGEQIKFLDLFASNTPMNSIIYDIEYERLAWDTEFNFEMSEKELDNATNMDKRDTSEYEDIILKVINKYKNIDKDKIEFYVTTNTIHVDLPVGEGGEEISYTMELYKYIDYVTMYKKFLTDKVVYENIPSNKLLVFNDMLGYIPEYYKIESDNLFISIIGYYDTEYEQEEEKELIKQYSQSAVNKKNELMKKHKEKILAEVRNLAKNNKNKGYMARFVPYSSIGNFENDYGGETLIYLSLAGNIEEMDIDYYKENAFKLLAKQNVRPRASLDGLLTGFLDDDNDNIKSLLDNEDMEDIVDTQGYYTLDGKLIAKSYEEVEEYIDNKYTRPEPEPEQTPAPAPEQRPELVPEQTPEEQPEVEIYKEEQ